MARIYVSGNVVSVSTV